MCISREDMMAALILFIYSQTAIVFSSIFYEKFFIFFIAAILMTGSALLLRMAKIRYVYFLLLFCITLIAIGMYLYVPWVKLVLYDFSPMFFASDNIIVELLVSYALYCITFIVTRLVKAHSIWHKDNPAIRSDEMAINDTLSRLASAMSCGALLYIFCAIGSYYFSHTTPLSISGMATIVIYLIYFAEVRTSFSKEQIQMIYSLLPLCMLCIALNVLGIICINIMLNDSVINLFFMQVFIYYIIGTMLFLLPYFWIKRKYIIQ